MENQQQQHIQQKQQSLSTITTTPPTTIEAVAPAVTSATAATTTLSVSGITTISSASTTTTPPTNSAPLPMTLAGVNTTRTNTTTSNNIFLANVVVNSSSSNFPASIATASSLATPSASSVASNLTTTASTTASTFVTNVTPLSSSTTSQQPLIATNNIIDAYKLTLQAPITATPTQPAIPPTPSLIITTAPSTAPTTLTTITAKPSTSIGSTIQQISGANNNSINFNNFSSNSTSDSGGSSSAMMMTPATTMGIGLKLPSVQPASTQQSQQSKRTGEQKRPMNAFLMFCKRHRSLVRERHPSLENRGITKILGDWWSKLDKVQKSGYTDLARQHKEAFMRANPDFKWYKTTDLRPPANRNIGPASPATLHMASVTDMITNASKELLINNNVDPNVPVIIGPYVTKNNGDSATVNTTNSNSVSSSPKQLTNNTMEKNALTNNDERQHGAPKPPKKRYLENGQHMLTTSSSSNDCWTSTNNNATIINNSSGMSKLQINHQNTQPEEACQNNLKTNHCATKNNSNNISETDKEDQMLTNDTIVPIFFDKVTFDRVIEHAFSDKKTNNINSPSSVVCNDLVNNVKPTMSGTIGDQANSQQSTANKLCSSIPLVASDRNINKVVEDLGAGGMGAADLSIQRKQSVDEPVDFSMNRTYEASNQNIINTLIDRMLSESRDSNTSLNLSLSNNNTSQPMDQDPQPNQRQLQQSSSTLSSGTNSSNHHSNSINIAAATNTSSFTDNKTSVPEFDLEKKLTELPLFELTNGKFEGIDQRQHDGLATLAEAAVAVQQLPPQLPQHQRQQHNPLSINVVKNESAASLATLAAVAGQTPSTVVPAASLKD